ncbi:bifunctional metallophosphatase/5'-nucleotidase [Solibacillus sp. R5-41]|uniref:bifunctional metallophosphatase/5'-nucleotidase n=1 Tax=Solibacillus sp. R5-41 TaxID=2048654 RepID=UPI000C126547|nr:bifunctional UDP-sugar hydrolase/5'-nucleotidase [Solibacillus sp. R5-41]ATP41576.1 bifunctional metallophosphatase/5'-nucleotidase [Solibacillus sp. R5-41]
MRETIHIFHTNDLHSHFTYWQRSQSFIKTQRHLLAQRGEPSFLFDLGDHLDRSNMYTEATLGKGNIAMLNHAQYDVITIGNNEGITLPHDVFYHLYDEAKFEVVVGNLQSELEANPKWLKPYTILTTKYGTKIGIIAATARFDVFYKELGWHVDEPRKRLIEQALQLHKVVDMIVCLSHLGITEDELLAKECPVIDVIFGAHTHHIFPQGQMVNNVLLTGGGKFGQYTGHLTLQFDHELKKITSKTDILHENMLLPEVEDDEKWQQNLQKEAKKILQQTIFTSPKTYHKEWFHRSQLSDLFAECLYDYTKADCLLFNAGIFVENMKKGNVSSYSIHKILPHPINVCILQLTGNELKEIFIQSENEEWPRLELKGLGFRGVIFGKILNYGLSMNKQREFFIQGERIEPTKVYRIATLDLFTFGFFFPSFKYAKKQYILPEFIRDIFGKYCEDKFG